MDAPKNSGRFGKGNPGKPKGAVTKTPALIREMVAEALDRAGGVDYLLGCAKNPKTQTAFLGLVGKVLPVQVIGDEKNPLQHHWTISFKAPNGN